MNLYELSGDETSPVYQRVESSNQARVYYFLSSMIQLLLRARSLGFLNRLLRLSISMP